MTPIDAYERADREVAHWQRILAGTGNLDASCDRRYVVEHTVSAEAVVNEIYTACASAKVAA